jgi:predicted ATPase
MARLDRLGTAKEVAQIGAAIGREFSHGLLAAVTPKPEAQLGTSLDRLIRAGLLLRKGRPPHATYLFKHALVQDAAYGTLLRQPRRALHARIADTIERQFADIAEAQPDLLARHYTEAGLIDKSAVLWGKAGLRSQSRSALVEAIEQLTHALNQIATLPSTPALRRDEIELHVALINPLMHIKGHAAPETKAVAERARLLIEQAEALGEPPKDPLLVFSAVYALFTANFVAFNGDVLRERAAQIMALAERQRGKGPLMLGHRAMHVALVHTGCFAEAVVHADQALALYDPVEHRPLATRLALDPRITALTRSRAVWALGYPEAGLAGTEQALSAAREAGNPASLMNALAMTIVTQLISGNYVIAQAQSDELIALAEERGSVFWKTAGMLGRAGGLALARKASNAVGFFTAAIPAWRSTGSRLYLPVWLSLLARAYAELGQFNDAWSHIHEAITTVETTTKERWYEAEVHRTAGEIALTSPEHDAARAEDCFERALGVARSQKAKSFELRAAMSMARLWRDQGKRDEAGELLAPVYGWFTEGFDTLDLKQAKALLDELAQ